MSEYIGHKYCWQDWGALHAVEAGSGADPLPGAVAEQAQVQPQESAVRGLCTPA